jgi:hypothetical protein
MPEIAITYSWKPQGGQRHRKCRRLRSNIAETPRRVTGTDLATVPDRDSRSKSISLLARTDELPRYQAIDVHRLPSPSQRPTRRFGRTLSARRACLQHRRFRDNQPVPVKLRPPTRNAVDPTSSVGGELHQSYERVASSTLEKLAASKIPEIAIKDSWKPGMGWSIVGFQRVPQGCGLLGVRMRASSASKSAGCEAPQALESARRLKRC